MSQLMVFMTVAYRPATTAAGTLHALPTVTINQHRSRTITGVGLVDRHCTPDTINRFLRLLHYAGLRLEPP
ncbi:MAG TPA: hypothetical protein VHZ51_18300 [Ktedonobacteraceae bacterium]|nr:hypothetical protein [Ktedonobacteraceae bacterium]